MGSTTISKRIKAAVLAAALHVTPRIGPCEGASLARRPSPSPSAFVATTDAVVRSRGSARRRGVALAADADDDVAGAPLPAATAAVAGVVGSSPFRIREATRSDLPRAADLTTDGFYPDLKRNPMMRPIRYLMELDRLQNNFPYKENDRHFYLVVCKEGTANDGGGEVVGFCDLDGRIPEPGFSLSPFVPNVVRPVPYFSDLAVQSDHRRRGVASALMTEAERRSREMGFEELYLGVRSTNGAALRMYDKIGYESIGLPSDAMLAFLDMQKGVTMLRRSLEDK